MTVLKLVLKDFRVNGLYLSISLGILFLASSGLVYGVFAEQAVRIDSERVAIDSIEILLYIALMIFTSKLVSLLFFKVDELYDVNTFFASLPVKRSHIVKARYISSLLQILLSFVVHLIATLPVLLIMGIQNHAAWNVIYHPTLWFVSLLIILLSNAVTFPFYFRFGLSRGAAIIIICQILIVVLALALIINFDAKESLFDWIEETVLWINNQKTGLMVLVSAGLVSLLISGSAMVSTQLYKAKDL